MSWSSHLFWDYVPFAKHETDRDDKDSIFFRWSIIQSSKLGCTSVLVNICPTDAQQPSAISRIVLQELMPGADDYLLCHQFNAGLPYRWFRGEVFIGQKKKLRLVYVIKCERKCCHCGSISPPLGNMQFVPVTFQYQKFFNSFKSWQEEFCRDNKMTSRNGALNVDC